VGIALEILQKIARGTNRVGDLIKEKDFAWGRSGVPMRFEIEVEIQEKIYTYVIAFELPEGFRELRVHEERLVADGRAIYTRQAAQVKLARATLRPGQFSTVEPDNEAPFRIDWHLVALPIVQEQSQTDPLFIFKRWLARMLILQPTTSLMTGESTAETLEPTIQVTNFGAWFAGLLAYAPAAYAKIDEYIRQIMPDFKDIKNPLVGRDSRSLEVHFSNGNGSISVPFEDLSDGEKCFFVCALVLAANRAYGPLFCFWDEPDNYLALSEVGHFVIALRQTFQSGSQFIATSHNPEAIRRFSDENTFYLYRNNHLHPTVARPIGEMRSTFDGDLVSALVRGDVEP
jgi:AAA domain, putative AbiEii toxin, Type IV TA system